MFFFQDPWRARNQIFLLPGSDSLIAIDSKCIALISSHFARMGSILTPAPVFKASRRWEGGRSGREGGRDRQDSAVKGVAAVTLDLS